VLGWFDDQANFKTAHNEKVEIEKIERWLELDEEITNDEYSIDNEQGRR
jgi:hypothetical protein